MFIRLVILFTVLPLIELAVLIRIGTWIGALNTILLVIATAVVGASLAKREGLSTLSKIRLNMSRGIVPGDDLLDGLLILIAAVVLITPGLLTDIFGFAVLIRPSRRWIKNRLKRVVKRHIDKGSMEIRIK